MTQISKIYQHPYQRGNLVDYDPEDDDENNYNDFDETN